MAAAADARQPDDQQCTSEETALLDGNDKALEDHEKMLMPAKPTMQIDLWWGMTRACSQQALG